MIKNIIKNAVLNASATALYVVCIASFLFYVPKQFGPETADTVLVPIIMLMLLVFSAALVGSLIFGRPVLWYLDNRKKEALVLLFWTLGIFFAFTIIAMALLFFIVR